MFSTLPDGSVDVYTESETDPIRRTLTIFISGALFWLSWNRLCTETPTVIDVTIIIYRLLSILLFDFRRLPRFAFGNGVCVRRHRRRTIIEGSVTALTASEYVLSRYKRDHLVCLPYPYIIFIHIDIVPLNECVKVTKHVWHVTNRANS